MGKINILSKELSNKIAAGEVVERPASVVKELLENSIDAGSKNIKIIIKEFGVKEIRVVDDGEGILNEDIEKAFTRHATSKIIDDYDLFHINTLGFRGEALASISSVSEIEINSSTKHEKQGKSLLIKGGEIVKNTYCPPINGTDIKVKNLFYNTPARLKYLRSKYTEQANILNIINKLALSYINISFEVIIDDKVMFRTFGDGNISKIISSVYNYNIAKSMLEFKTRNDDYEIIGYISNPEQTRANKNYINIFVNGRYIKNYLIQNAVISAYGTFLMKNRYPIVVININMNSSLVDVNVHPTKQEVRLSKEKDLIFLIENKIKERLKSNIYIPNGLNNLVRKKNEYNYFQTDFDEDFNKSFYINEDKEYYDENNKDNNEKLSRDNFNFIINKTNGFSTLGKKECEKEYIEKKEKDVFAYENKEKTPEFIKKDVNKSLPNLVILAQIFKTYILAQADEDLFLIDQHAAQERYNFEKNQKNFLKFKKQVKQLLIPIIINFEIQEIPKIKEILFKLEELGINLEEFGENNYILREVPIWIEVDEEFTVKNIIEKLSFNKNIGISELRNDAIAMISCKSSIKANQFLTVEEMQKVVNDLYSCENPFICPHGRPVISKIRKKDLEKMFKRIV